MVDHTGQVAQSWLLPGEVGTNEIVSRLDSSLRWEITVDDRQEITLYDTFDWQLWFQNLVFYRLDSTCILCDCNRFSSDESSNEPIASCEPLEQVPRFWWDWPEGGMRDELRGIIGLRALLPLTTLGVATHRAALRTEDDKTVTRLLFQRFVRVTERREQILGMCRVLPIRGYDRERGSIEENLARLGFPRIDTPPLQMILTQTGHRPQPWSSKPTTSISPELTAREATRRLASASLDICRDCEQGIIDDLDTEFLHDYRVSLRRVRSLLKLVKEVYPRNLTAQTISELSQFARQTNRLRDLDVFLIDREQHAEHVPGELAHCLDKMFGDLNAERDEQQHSVSSRLQSDAYRRSISQVQGVFAEAKWWPVTVNSHVPVASLANQLIPRRYRKICRMISRISTQSPDAQVHDVRLEAKKLRYLVEFFGTLYVPELVMPLTKRLKSIQRVLGTFNDLAVQQEFLRGYVYNQVAGQADSHELTLAVGSLVGILHQRQKAVRSELNAHLAEFADKNTKSMVQQLTDDRRLAA